MSFKVINKEGETIVVDSINPTIHRHLSGREFTEDDVCISKPIISVDEWSKDWDKSVWVVMEKVWNEILVKDFYTDEEAIEKYKEKFGKKPHHKMKLETIIKNLND